MKKILYIASSLPALSATFIDSEIRVLAAAGYEIRTVSRGSPIKGEVSDETVEYYKNTLWLDQVSIITQIFAQFYVMLIRPVDWYRIISLIFAEKEIRNIHDRLRLLKHFCEACYVYSQLIGEPISHIHAHFLNAPTSIALYLSILLNIPYSFTLHGSNIFLDPLMLETKLKLCQKAVSISEFNKKYLMEKYGDGFRDKIHIIHCGIDTELFKPEPRHTDGTPIVLSVGRLTEIKGFCYLLDACRILKDRKVAFNCLIVGDGEDKDMLLRRSAELGLGDIVKFLGSQLHDNVLKLLQEATIFVLPSIVTDEGGREGIPVALMEAMAMELPVISTRTAGIPELINDKKEGILVEHSNATELASAIEFFINDAGAREAIGKQARIKVLHEFNINSVPSQFENIFAPVVSQR